MTESEPPSIVRGKCAGWADVEVMVEKSDCTVEAIERFILGRFGGVARKDAIIDFYSRLNGKRVMIAPLDHTLQSVSHIEVEVRIRTLFDKVIEWGMWIERLIPFRAIPQVRLTKRVEDLPRQLPTPAGSCPNPIGLEQTVAEVMEHINRTIDKQSSTSAWKEPLMISRCPRGGKSTVLREIYAALRAQGINSLYVTFNGDTSFHQKYCESDSDALRRLITSQLTDDMGSTTGTRPEPVSWEVLDAHIGTAPFVLLIDDIHVLGPEIRRNLADVLKAWFLDKSNWQLVFSTHRPILDIQGVEDSFFERDESQTMRSAWRGWMESIRDVRIVSMLPTCLDVTAVKAMDQCSAVTLNLAAYFAGVPSLVYADQSRLIRAVSGQKVARALRSGPAPLSELGPMAQMIIYGFPTDSTRKYLAFCSSIDAPIGSLVSYRWPPCYLVPMLERIGSSVAAKAIASVLQGLRTAADEEGDEKVWEITIKAAILLRMVITSEYGEEDAPFDLCTRFEGREAEVRLVALGAGVRSVSECKEEIMNYIASVNKMTLVVFAPTGAAMERFDGYAAAVWPGGEKYCIAAYQCMASREGAFGEVPSWLQAGVHVFRSKASEKARSTRSCTYMNCDEVSDFLGLSLQILLPRPGDLKG